MRTLSKPLTHRRTVIRRIATLVWAAAIAYLFSGCATIHPPGDAVKAKRVMETTGYCKCKKCCNWRRNWRGKAVIASGPNEGKPKKVGVTASGTKAKRGVIAADTTRYPFGTVMYVPGYGYGRVEDRGSAIKGEHIDLCFKSHREALNWGRQKKEVIVWVQKR